jgi:CRP/FNR family cyclic AMP-dependent transcriptional regulator
MTNLESFEETRNTACFSPESLTKIKEIMYEYKASTNSYLYREGDPANKLYYIHQGSIRISKATDDGKPFILAMHQAGDLFGQVDPFTDSVHSFGAELMENTVIGVLQQKDLEVLLWQNRDIGVEFMKWMGLMQWMTQTKLRDLMLFGKPGALCSVLIRLGNTYGITEGKQTVISKTITHSELAEMIGSTRESVNRILSKLKRDDVISYKDGYIVIEDLQYLRQICHCENCPKEICRI